MALNSLTRTVSKQVLALKTNSPTLMFVVGIAAMGASTVLACRATLKLESTLAETQDVLDDLREIEKREDITNQAIVREKVIAYGDLAIDLTRLYGPAVVVGAVGVVCLTGSHNMLTKRNAALTAAYAGLERSYNAYRRRVREEIGEDAERNLHYRSQENELKRQTSVEGPKGKKGASQYSMYCVWFDETNANWKPDPLHNKIFLRTQQNYFNDRLAARGYVLLNEVYNSLGFPETTAGSVVGWVFDGIGGDAYIDFGIFEGRTDAARAFVTGFESSVLLDFNVDGVINHKIDQYNKFRGQYGIGR